MASRLIETYMREERLPHIWCAGCGHGILMRDVALAIDNLKLDKKDVVIVSGIGCSSRAAGYMNFDTLHTTHGRAIAFATGIKMAKPHLKVVVITGDGDATAIGGNHLIHAARRNIDMTVVVFNNNIYGMTGGQFSPTTPMGDFATTAPYGSIDPGFRHPQTRRGRGRDLHGAGHGLPRAADGETHRKRHRPRGLFPGRVRFRLSHLLRPQEQKGRRGGDAQVAARQRRACFEGARHER